MPCGANAHARVTTDPSSSTKSCVRRLASNTKHTSKLNSLNNDLSAPRTPHPLHAAHVVFSMGGVRTSSRSAIEATVLRATWSSSRCYSRTALGTYVKPLPASTAGTAQGTSHASGCSRPKRTSTDRRTGRAATHDTSRCEGLCAEVRPCGRHRQ